MFYLVTRSKAILWGYHLDKIGFWKVIEGEKG
jgi:hypothetical protein